MTKSGSESDSFTQLESKPPEEVRARQAMDAIPHKVLVMSGKGGVGKTTVAVNLAYALADAGLEVGLLDADLHGPNVALMTGLQGQRSGFDDNDHLATLQPRAGVRVLSIAFFLPESDTAVAWRGPRKYGAIRQLMADGDWGGVDVLVVDCPPGTGDEPMAVAELVGRTDGVVVVTSPQEVALLDSRKCICFVREISLKVLGVVENLSGFVCPTCGDRVDLFSQGGGEKLAAEYGVPFLGRVPLSAAMVAAGDQGLPLVAAAPKDPAAEALSQIALRIAEGWPELESEPEADTDSEKPTQPTERDHMSSVRYFAVASEDDRALEGEVAMHFGRCPFYTLVEVQDQKVKQAKVVQNPHFSRHEPGVMPRFVSELGAHVVIAGGMGPRAVQMFHGFGVDVATGAVGTVGKVVEAYLDGRLSGIVPCNHDHPDSCGGHHADEHPETL